MRPLIEFFVSGEPKGQPRPRAFARNGMVRVYDPGTAEGWKSQVASAWKELGPVEAFTGPVSVSLAFLLPRPKSHFKKDQLRTDAPDWCCKKPDADNLAKAVLDALTQLGVWQDDAQVAQLNVSKRFALRSPGAKVSMVELENWG